jgi:hypothetical protein
MSTDPNYNGKDADDVPLTNIDNDSAGITVSAAAGPTTEAGGTTTFTVVLNSQPTATVTIPLSSNNPSEGVPLETSLSFTTTNWDAPQVVTVKGVDDAVADGNQLYTIVTEAAVSSDAGYSGKNAADVDVINIDNDSAGILVTAPPNPTTTEAGGTTTFSVVLTSKPTANVTIPLASSRPSEGIVSDPNPANLVFTPTTWNIVQSVTAKGVDDNVADGNQVYVIQLLPAMSGDLGYNGRDGDDVDVTNTDNDSAGITLLANPDLTTTEAGGKATFQIVLNSQPLAGVSIAIHSSDTAEGLPNTSLVSFTTDNWNIAQTVTVTGQDDAVADGNQVYTIVTDPSQSSDAAYSAIDIADVPITNIDNDTPGILLTLVSPATCTTSEAGATSTFSMVLTSQPTADVVIGLSTSQITEATVAPTTITFTSGNWNLPVTITVTGVDDLIPDGDQMYTLNVDPSTSLDPKYNGINVANVSCVNLDNEPPP